MAEQGLTAYTGNWDTATVVRRRPCEEMVCVIHRRRGEGRREAAAGGVLLQCEGWAEELAVFGFLNFYFALCVDVLSVCPSVCLYVCVSCSFRACEGQ